MSPPHHPRAASLRRHLCLALLAILATACAHRGAPAVYPDLDAAQARPSLVVTRFLGTGELPAYPECASKDVLCMDPAPTWIKLQARETVYGASPPGTFFASTTSHGGRIDAYGTPRKPMLMLLLAQENNWVMVRYARANLDTDSQRQLHVVLNNSGPYWLPCSVRELREDITDPVLAHASRITREDYEQWHAESHADSYRVEGQFAYPRYSLPIARLQAHLAGKALSAADFTCGADPG
ncbi:MAG: hypothetical protein K0M70_10275 [Arenimonas sp.]|uniref:hypothetical protein n=1 Tax=Arenimonas sp. TaxID=1872635 RepID=UPI0025C19A92|nr:hypothetical protein [Arenimonas sp.]MBW8368231.1 hypothetical protein [Arenimonas sp.]